MRELGGWMDKFDVFRCPSYGWIAVFDSGNQL
jgi:hypothetical protein